jgi:hypothetical protein
MRKLSLKLDSLEVESFQTASAVRGAGTVRGLAYTVLDPAEPVEPETQQNSCDTCTITADITCATCDEPTCNSCHLTQCYTGNQPVCCA